MQERDKGLLSVVNEGGWKQIKQNPLLDGGGGHFLHFTFG